MAELIQNCITERVDRGRRPAPEVENPADRFRVVEACDPGSYDIVDEYEVAGLFTATINPDGLATQEVAEENCQHSLVWIR